MRVFDRIIGIPIAVRSREQTVETDVDPGFAATAGPSSGERVDEAEGARRRDDDGNGSVIAGRVVARRAAAVISHAIKAGDVFQSGLGRGFDELIEALRLMRDGGFRHVPVVHEGLVIGIVARGDFRGLEQDRLDEETGIWERLG